MIDTEPRCPNCGGDTRIVGAGAMKARICETAGCEYPDGTSNTNRTGGDGT